MDPWRLAARTLDSDICVIRDLLSGLERDRSALCRKRGPTALLPRLSGVAMLA
jgi:hypothetical protein